MGPFPDSASAAYEQERLEEYHRRLESIAKPVSDDEAEALLGLFGPDDCFGLAWTLVHLVESAPGWPLVDRIPESGSPWLQVLRERAGRSPKRNQS
jgi:hypothetical protein